MDITENQLDSLVHLLADRLNAYGVLLSPDSLTALNDHLAGFLTDTALCTISPDINSIEDKDVDPLDDDAAFLDFLLSRANHADQEKTSAGVIFSGGELIDLPPSHRQD